MIEFKKCSLYMSSRSFGNVKDIDRCVFKIPEDIYPLEFSSISKIDEHPDLKYLYILYDDLDNYDDDDEVLMFDSFFVKLGDELLETTTRCLKDYIIKGED